MDPRDDDTNTASAVSPPSVDGSKCPYLLIIAGPRIGELHKLSRLHTIIGRGGKAHIRVVDDGVSREHVEFTNDNGRVTVRDLGSTNGTYCNGVKTSARGVSDGDKISIGSTTILKFTYQDGMDEAFQQELYASALRDQMTGALKKEQFLERLKEELAFALRHGSPVALIFLDLDRFKSINDTYGHPAGDKVLSATAGTLRGLLRREDVFGRYGGEEFAIASRSLDLRAAEKMAERLRRAIETSSVDVGSSSIGITASFGVAVCPARGIGDSAALISAADRAMYRAKEGGRNKVELAASSEPDEP